MGGTLKRFFALFLMILLEVGLFAAPRAAYATPSVGSGVQSTTAIINRIINSTPGLNTVTTTGTGAVVRSTASTAVNVGRGVTVAVPTVAEATITAGRLAGIAGRVIKAGSVVGIATMVAPWILDQSGYKVCPPPDFFCKPDPSANKPPSVVGGWTGTAAALQGKTFDSGEAACATWSSTQPQENSYLRYTYTFRMDAGYDNRGGCGVVGNRKDDGSDWGQGWVRSISVQSSNGKSCPAGYHYASLNDLTCVPDTPKMIPATESDVAGAVEGAITGNAGRVGQLHNAESSANLPTFAPGDLVTVTAPPSIKTPPSVQTQTVANPDGTTSTIKTETQTEVKPQVQGSNLGDTKVVYPATTTTTTTTTNNNTNVTTTNTTIINNYGTESSNQPQSPPYVPPVPLPQPGAPPVIVTSPSSPEIKLPDDYNREKTQLSLLDEIKKLTGEITAKAPDGEKDLDAVKAKNQEGTDAVAGITESSIGLANWFPTFPTAACVDPKVPNPITGAMVGVPICDKVDIFQTFISAVICVFALFGCVREVQSALKA